MAAETVVQPDDLHWDPYDYALHADSHPTWRRMREEAPLYRNDEYDFWALTRFDDVLDVLGRLPHVQLRQGRHPRGDPRGEQRDHRLDDLRGSAAAHVHRHLLSRAFTPSAIKTIEDRVREYVRNDPRRAGRLGGFDFVEDFGARVPGMVIAAMLGTPDSDLDEIRRLTDAQIHIDEGVGYDDRTNFDEASARDRRVLHGARAGPPQEPDRRHDEHRW